MPNTSGDFLRQSESCQWKTELKSRQERPYWHVRGHDDDVPFSNGSSWVGSGGGGGTKTGTKVVSIPLAVLISCWRVTGSWSCSLSESAGKEWTVDLRSVSATAAHRWAGVTSVVVLTCLASKSSSLCLLCMTLMRSSIGILTFTLESVAMREAV